MKMISKIVSAITLSIISLSAFCANDSFLSNTAMSYFTKEDWKLFNKAQSDALNKGKDGAKVNWSNPQSGSFGYIIPSKAANLNGLRCRTLSFHNTAHLINGAGTYRFCYSNKKWMIY